MLPDPLAAFEIALVQGRLPRRLVRALETRRVACRGFSALAQVTAGGHVLTFRIGWSRLNLILARAGDPVLDARPATIRLAAEQTSDELRHEQPGFALTFLARTFAPRVDREFDRLVESVETAARSRPDSLVRRDGDVLTTIHFSPGERGLTIETNRALPAERRILSTYTRAERPTSGRRAGS